MIYSEFKFFKIFLILILFVKLQVSECSDPRTRGVIGSFPSIAMSAGVLLSYIIGYYAPWDLLAWCSSACPSKSIITMKKDSILNLSL